ncbi:MAG TPA: hypothetical protein VI454_19780 [Verrucomicrobiae bacterium]|jgi:hypothetical protein
MVANITKVKWMALGALVAVASLLALGFLLRAIDPDGPTLSKLSSLRNHNRFECEEIVSRIQRSLNEGGPMLVTHQGVASARQVWRPLGDAEHLDSSWLFAFEDSSKAIARGERSVPVVVERIGKYGADGGGYVGFANPEEVRWFPAPEHINMVQKFSK